jgi:beta-galactosidase GanA
MSGSAVGRRHPARLLPEQRSLLGLCQEDRPRHGGSAGKHPQLVAWQIDNNIGTHSMQPSFNRRRAGLAAWLQAKYETLERLNDMMGTRFWGQTIGDWSHVPMPMDRAGPA